MTHLDYLEAHHELVTAVLPGIAIRNGRGDHEEAAQLVTLLKARLDALWAERVETAEREVAP